MFLDIKKCVYFLVTSNPDIKTFSYPVTYSNNTELTK